MWLYSGKLRMKRLDAQSGIHATPDSVSNLKRNKNNK